MPLLLLLVGLLLPPPAHAGQATASIASPTARSLDLLLQQREALALTPDQVARITEIQRQLAADTDPLIDRMLALRARWRQLRRAAESGRPGSAARAWRIRLAADRLQGQMQVRNRASMIAVNRVLSAAQREQLRALISARRQATADAVPAPR